MSTLKLTYFNSAGRAEPIRMALQMANVPFEDIRLDFAEFAKAKAANAFPLGSLPTLEVDGHVYTQSSAMLRFAAQLGDGELYPTAPHQALAVDSVIETLNDTLSHAMAASFWEKDMTKKLEMRAALLEGELKQAFSYIEGIIEKSGGPFVAGNALSTADMVVASHVMMIRRGDLDGVTADDLAPYPRLGTLTDAYLEEPRVVGYKKLQS